MISTKKKKILAISSGGGHWVQLLRLRKAFEGHNVIYATVKSGYHKEIQSFKRFYTIPDATQWDKAGLVLLCLKYL